METIFEKPLDKQVAENTDHIAKKTEMVFTDYKGSAGQTSYTFTETGLYMLAGAPYDSPDTGVILYLLAVTTSANYVASHAIKTGSATTVSTSNLTVTINSTQAYMQYSIVKIT